jgi:hypothetical protein
VNADTVSIGHAVQLSRGLNRVTLRIAELCLNPGVYAVGLWAADAVGTAYDHVQDAFEVEVIPAGTPSLGSRPGSDGLVACRLGVDPVAPLTDLPAGA